MSTSKRSISLASSRSGFCGARPNLSHRYGTIAGVSTSRSNLSPGHRLGRFGEEVAAGFIERRGGVVVARNLRVGRNEIDLLAEIGGERVAVEVKTATSRGGAPAPADNFDDAQERRVWDAARALRPPVRRVDLICVTVDPEGVGIRWSPRAE